MPEQFDPRIYEQFIPQSVPVSSEQINQYNQQTIPVAVPVPEIESYAPQQQYPQQQYTQQAAPQRTLQPDRDRMAYYKLVQDRFNEIVNYAGGIENVTKAKNIELAQKKAAADVAAYYGAPPEIKQPEQPLQTRVIPSTGKIMVSGAGMSSPQFVDVAQPQQPLSTQVIPGTNKVAVTINGQTQFLDAAQQQQAQDTVTPVIDATTGMPILGIGRAPDGSIIKFEAPQMATKAAEQNAMLASDVLSSVDSLLADKDALEWAGGKSGTYGGYFFRSIEGTKQKIEQLRDQIGLFGRKSIAGQGQGSISDAEQKMAKDALAQIVTEGTDEQLISSLEAVRNKFGNILGRIQSEASGQPTGQPMSQPAVQPKVRTFVPGKGFQD